MGRRARPGRSAMPATASCVPRARSVSRRTRARPGRRRARPDRPSVWRRVTRRTVRPAVTGWSARPGAAARATRARPATRAIRARRARSIARRALRCARSRATTTVRRVTTGTNARPGISVRLESAPGRPRRVRRATNATMPAHAIRPPGTARTQPRRKVLLAMTAVPAPQATNARLEAARGRRRPVRRAISAIAPEHAIRPRGPARTPPRRKAPLAMTGIRAPRVTSVRLEAARGRRRPVRRATSATAPGHATRPTELARIPPRRRALPVPAQISAPTTHARLESARGPR